MEQEQEEQEQEEQVAIVVDQEKEGERLLWEEMVQEVQRVWRWAE